MPEGPDDRPKKGGKRAGTPRVLRSARIRVPDKEMFLMRPDDGPPPEGTCSCHSVCACVPVSTCPCDTVCSCDAVCAANTCACDAFDNPLCTCDPQCACQNVCGGHCSLVYWYPN